MIGYGKPGHFGGSCSIAEIITALYYYKMKHDPKNPSWPERDRLILSKGHAGVMQYVALAVQGYFPEEELKGLKTLGSPLQGHPDMHKVPGIEANTGSLGQGLSISCGVAAGLRIDKSPSRVYCIVGDGEIAEGQIWEAAMAASYYKLDNLVGIMDCNKVQAMGAVADRFNTNPYREKWEAFGWEVREIDGHDLGEVTEALDWAETVKGKPVMIIAHTIKGKCIPFAENNPAFHNGTMTKEQYEMACTLLCSESEA
jgi:transketolase